MMRRRACLLLLATGVACAPTPDAPPAPRLLVADVLGGIGTPGLARALEPRTFVFPADHGPHETFAAEWWYLTGNLQTADGQPFGYQVTFFRTSLGTTNPTTGGSAWATTQVWMAHFAVVDVEAGRFYAFDRFQRGALGLAGATASPWRVWLDDWSLAQEGDAPFPLRVRAREPTDSSADGGYEIAVDLRISPLKDVVLQGDRGLSQKGPTAGNASYYFSFTRLQTDGVIRLGDRELAVEGTSWLDREWSTSALEDGQIGWDWFALQLSDDTELMFYRLREADGSPSRYSAGTLVRADATSSALDAEDVQLSVERTWASPIDGTVYPAAWRLVVPARGIDLRIEPLLENQELDLAFRYWEGAVRASGNGQNGAPVSGRGYVELTGYAESGRPR